MLQEDLLQRLALHDSGGQRRESVAAGGALGGERHSGGAYRAVTLYSQTADLRWLPMSTWSLGTSPLPASELSAAPYVLHASAPGYGEHSLAVVLHRGRERQVQLSLPSSGRPPMSAAFSPCGWVALPSESLARNIVMSQSPSALRSGRCRMRSTATAC